MPFLSIGPHVGMNIKHFSTTQILKIGMNLMPTSSLKSRLKILMGLDKKKEELRVKLEE